MIPFNKPYLTGNETLYIADAVNSGHISGNGDFTKKVQRFFEEKFNFGKALLTTSCTDALEMAAMLADVGPGDEVIVPSFTFVSSALAFVRQGAHIVFCDSLSDHPNMDVSLLPSLITEKTKAIVVVHYAGVACDMDLIAKSIGDRKIFIIEDAAQAISSYYKGRALGSIGHMSAFSFHETKNINSGEGGLLAVNDQSLQRRAEIIWEKGTNRAEFFRGEVNKYGWVDTGSSFLPSEIIAAYLWAQLEKLEDIQKKRVAIWEKYYQTLNGWARKQGISLPLIPPFATNNGHMFYLVCQSAAQRDGLITHLRKNNVYAVFHYLSLHKSEYYRDKHSGSELPNSDHFTDCLVRLPLFFTLSTDDQAHIIDSVLSFK